MKYTVNNLRLTFENDLEELKKAAAKKLKINSKDFISFRITKESIDARRKPKIDIVYSVLVETDKLINITDRDVKQIEDTIEETVTMGNVKLNHRPIIVGSGPAGIFAGLVLAQNGFKPIILERGESVEARTKSVDKYWRSGELNAESNVQFGEGGAGTFSDGKLTTRINDRRCERVLKEYYASGAPEEILYKARPHIGTDILKEVAVNMRKRIQEFGGEVRFNSKLTGINLKNGRIAGVVVNGAEEIPAEIVVLALGHSARDTFEMLLAAGIQFVQKPFSIGVRIEHPQHIINLAQYGEAASHPRLGAADYQLFYKKPDRTVYSFCMCPGGIVVASASEQGMVVTNGMSEFARDRDNSNSALVVSVEPGDFGSSHPLAGVEFQRRWEKLAFIAGGRDNSAPVQRLEDFIEGRAGSIGSVKPSYTGNISAADINQCLPRFVTDPMKESFGYFDNKIKGFAMKDALLTGVETRTSSPVRMPRGETLEALGVGGLYPSGEGAGYAGGIVSAAVDGIRVAERIISTYNI